MRDFFLGIKLRMRKGRKMKEMCMAVVHCDDGYHVPHAPTVQAQEWCGAALQVLQCLASTLAVVKARPQKSHWCFLTPL